MHERTSPWCHPLCTVNNTKGNRQDILRKSAGPICMDIIFYVNYLDRNMCSVGKSNISEENIFIVWSSMHVLALWQTYSIIYLTLIVLIRWLSGNSNNPSKHGWTLCSMGRMSDVLEKKINSSLRRTTQVYNEYFILKTFCPFRNKLKIFDENIVHDYDNNKI